MGLIKTAVQAGAAYGIAKQGLKAYDQHEQRKQASQTNLNNMNNNNGGFQRSPSPAPPGYEYDQQAKGALQDPSQQMQQMHRDSYGYLHQGWCNAGCGGRCNGVVPAQ